MTPMPLAGIRPTAAHVMAPKSGAPWLGAGLFGAIVVLSAGGAFGLRRRLGATNETSS